MCSPLYLVLLSSVMFVNVSVSLSVGCISSKTVQYKISIYIFIGAVAEHWGSVLSIPFIPRQRD